MAYFEYGQDAINHLKNADEKLKMAIEQVGFIEREIQPNLFEGLISSIISQQISGKAAKTVWNRMVAELGEVTPKMVYKTEVEIIQKFGMTMRKASNIKAISEQIINGALDLESLKAMSDDAVVKTLTSLPGIGKWTAEMLLIFSMQRQDIVSWDDLGIRRGMSKLYEIENLDKKRFENFKSKYSPYGTVASFYLWAMS